MPVFLEPTQDHAFSVRWLAPELIYPEEFGFSACVRSKESDIYALSMLMYEVCAHLFTVASSRLRFCDLFAHRRFPVYSRFKDTVTKG